MRSEPAFGAPFLVGVAYADGDEVSRTLCVSTPPVTARVASTMVVIAILFRLFGSHGGVTVASRCQLGRPA